MKNYRMRFLCVLAAVLLLAGALALPALADGPYALTVEGGTAEGGAKFAAGTAVTLHADDAPDGKVFYRWTATAGAFSDAYSNDAVFTMPDDNATVTANYTLKTRVAVSGVSVAGKAYDGLPVAPEGAPVTDADTETAPAVLADGFVYTYLSADGGAYASAEPPKNAGSYRLIVTVADANESYFGTSGDIAFTITPRELTVTPAAGQTRYIGVDNPAFSYTPGAAVENETPAFTGALSGAADASAAAGEYAVTPGTLALSDSGAFLAANYTLTVGSATYAVVPFETTATATAADTNLGAGGVYTGDITLNAPEGFTIALSQTGAAFGPSVVVPAFSGETMQHYYLKAASGAVTGTKYIKLLCDAGRPTVSLYSPSVNAAVTAAQKIVLAVSETSVGVAGKTVTVTHGGDRFTADAASGVPVGGVSGGVCYIRYDLSQFAGLTLAANESYTVSADEGAFVDAAGNGSAAFEGGTFTTAAASDGVLVIFSLDGVAGVTANGSALVSGQAVASGTELVFPTDLGAGKAVSWRFFEEGRDAGNVTLAGYKAHVAFEAYLTVADHGMEGTAAIGGYTDMPRFGDTLTATLTGGAAGLTLNYTWLRGDEIVQTGDNSGYTVKAADIGSVLHVHIGAADRAGFAGADTPAAARALYAGAAPAAPAASARTTDSVTLRHEAGMEYRRDGGDWQDDPAFTGLTTGTAYRFTRRVKETDACCASAESEAAAISTYGPLSGTIELDGTLAFGSPVTARLAGSNNEGELTWRWLRGETVVCNAASYIPAAEDVGKALTVEATSSAQGGMLRHTTGNVQKAAYTGAAPAAPATAGYTGTSVTLIATDGYEYSMDAQRWQTNALFENLAPGTAYSFYQRVRETDTHLSSAASPALSVTTIPSLTGTVYVTGDARFGKTVVASLEQSNNTGTLTFTWKRGTMTVGTGSSYNVQLTDIGNQLSVVVTSSLQYGSVTRILGTVQKAEYVGHAPDAPTRLSRTTTSLTLTPLVGYEYSLDGVHWQGDNRFTGLKANTLYVFYQRVAATATVEASPVSAAAKLGTSVGSSSGGTGGGSSSSSDDDDGDTDDTGAGAPLYSLTLNAGDTRILSTTMTNLIRGNQTQDVTVKLDNASFTFFKGTMKAIPGQLWYDFGVKINGCIHEQTASSVAGGSYVATIHYNADGALPASANIKLWLGAKHAGKTLYYYKLDPDKKTLSYMQAAVVDVSGWITVVQDSCSDYVFCDTEVLSATPSPTAAAATPAPTASPAADEAGAPARKGIASGWVLALLICAALLFIVGGIWLYVRNKEE